jgi:5S rRNA maturation endonuclease (ribonuclease M5)
MTGNRFIMVCLVSVNNMEKNTEFRLQQTYQIKQDQRIYAIIITTDLNKEDENIKQIIERHLRKKKLHEIR